MTRVLITGATGLLGGVLAPELRDRGLDVITHGRRGPADLTGDLTSCVEAARVLDEAEPEVVLHLVALADVDGCESDPDLAYRLNVLALETVSSWIRAHASVRLVYVSTDQVYDGPGPHREDAVTLRNVYAMSKYCGERVARAAGATVLRTSFFGPSRTPGRRTFSDWLADCFERGLPTRLFTDVLFSPLSMETLASILPEVLRAPRPSVFNLGSRDGLSKRDFALVLAEQLGLSTAEATDGTCREHGLAARRPGDMRMDCTRFRETWGVELPTLEQEIRRLGRPR